MSEQVYITQAEAERINGKQSFNHRECGMAYDAIQNRVARLAKESEAEQTHSPFVATKPTLSDSDTVVVVGWGTCIRSQVLQRLNGELAHVGLPIPTEPHLLKAFKDALTAPAYHEDDETDPWEAEQADDERDNT